MHPLPTSDGLHRRSRRVASVAEALRPDHITYSVALNACQQWTEALELLKRLEVPCGGVRSPPKSEFLLSGDEKVRSVTSASLLVSRALARSYYIVAICYYSSHALVPRSVALVTSSFLLLLVLVRHLFLAIKTLGLKGSRLYVSWIGVCSSLCSRQKSIEYEMLGCVIRA